MLKVWNGGTKIREIVKMKDDWSLKGKLVHYIINVEDGKKSHIEEDKLSEKWITISSFYPKKDIETLRQKLIEDKKELQNKILHRISSYISLPMLIAELNEPVHVVIENISSIINEEFRKYEEKINKRFGVDGNE